MARSASKVGRGPCPLCGDRVSFFRTAGGLLNYACQACDHNAYADKGGKAESKWLASIDDPAEKPEQAGDPAPAPSPTPAPAPKPKRTASAFAVGNL